jgi:hypothetical protein
MQIKYLFLFGILFFSPILLSQEIGDPAPDFTHNTINGSTLSLSQFQGKVVFLYFFGYD